MEAYLITKDYNYHVKNSIFNAFFVHTIMAPFQRVIMIVQTQTANNSINPEKYFKSPRYVFYDIITRQGVRSLWRGSLLPTLQVLPMTLYYSFYGPYTKDYKINPEKYPKISFIVDLGRQMFGLLLSGLIIFPLFTVAIHLQTDMGTKYDRTYKGIRDCFSKISKNPREFYKGMFFFYALSIVSEGQINEFFERPEFYVFNHNVYQDIEEILLGLVAVTAANGIFFHMVDTLMFRIMIQTGRPGPKYKGVVDCITKTIQKDGFLAFTKGYSLYVIRALLLTFIAQWRIDFGNLN